MIEHHLTNDQDLMFALSFTIKMNLAFQQHQVY